MAKQNLGHLLNKLQAENNTLKHELIRLTDQQKIIDQLGSHCKHLAGSLQSVIDKNSALKEELERIKEDKPKKAPRKKVAVSG